MNYFTKEWYELCQKTSAHFFLEEAKEAESFCEEYFQRLYNEKLMEWLASEEEFCSYREGCGEAKESYIQPKPFDRKKASEQFYESFIYSQEHIKETLPKEILEKIADIRVYVLGKASCEVVKCVTAFCNHNEKLVKKTTEEYRKYYKKALESFDGTIIRNINFHDCIIIDIKEIEQSLSILFDNSGGFTNINEMKFENYEIIKQDSSLENS
ncbi:DUF4085 family protein [uncultured Clostridium sp.]|uniref:DUF4085 family protein n=1 Tax=uncultured Clostridium sp. TaxID=59620 RepID=UPI0028E8FF51|nr:DUF4085 family protein [uncultured Clostridium sp.]